MTIYDVKNVEALFHKLDDMNGSAALTFPNGCTYDWGKQGCELKALVSAFRVKCLKQVSVRLSDADDAVSLLHYVIGGC